MGFAMFDAKKSEGADEILDLAKEITRILGAHGPRKLVVGNWQEAADGDGRQFEFGIDGSTFLIAVPEEHLHRYSADYAVRAAVTECIVRQMGWHLDSA
jgi:hypothetical protein